MKKKSNIGLIILAAGSSDRMGKTKQLLKFKGKTLLQNAVQSAQDSDCYPIAVVLGANIEILKAEMKNLGVQIAENADWKSGMSSSIKAGLKKLLETEKQIDGALLMVCDQPLVSAEIINQIVETYQKANKLIVASRYGETFGVPALFSRRLFPQLFDLENPGGAKKIIEQFQSSSAFVSFPEGIFDIDTPEDYLKLTKART